jgi:hypothetical protein
MCVADSKPHDPPVKRAWAAWHNQATVSGQAQEAEAVARMEYDTIVEDHPEKEIRRAILERAIMSRRAADTAAETLLLAFVQVRALTKTPIGTSEQWEREHAAISLANKH